MITSLETNNARDMSSKKTVETFVITEDFIKLATPRNTIVLGSRGSGKTQLLRMLSYDLMRQLDRDVFSELPGKNDLIGIYVAFSSFWVKDIASKSWGEQEDLLYSFQWRLNLATCNAFVKCLEGILEEIVEDEFDRILIASDLAGKLYAAWFFDDNESVDSLRELKNRIARYDDERQAKEQTLLARGGRSGDHGMREAAFDTSLFAPIKTARNIVEQEVFELGQPNWLICLDEADFLGESYQRAINTCMRSRSERLFIKMSTLPFGHYIQETETPVDIDSGHDYEYLYIDHGAIRPDSNLKRQQFAFELIKKHFNDEAAVLDGYSSLKDLLGESAILNPKSVPLSDEEFEDALNKYATSRTIERATELRRAGKEKEYNDSIVRKMRGALWLKIQRSKRTGNRKPKAYYGAEVFLRCTDGNPRRMLELSRRLLEKAKVGNHPLVPIGDQHDALVDYSRTVLKRCRTEEGMGHDLHAFLIRIMKVLNQRFDGKISTDIVYSFDVKEKCDKETKRLIKKAVDLGLMYPNKSEPFVESFICEGKFHAAYVLAAGFFLLPREGSSLNILSLLREAKIAPNKKRNNKKDGNPPTLFEV